MDASNHIIMDYSIHDAIEAGFNHVVFIIREDINDIPGELPEGRTKPWETVQAVLVAKDIIKTPFIVINADDYYGKEGFKAVHEYLVNGVYKADLFADL